MRAIDFLLEITLGIVVVETTVIINVNRTRGFWKPINKMHMLSAVLYPIYLSSVLYASVECNRSNEHCDKLWKICSTLYMFVTMAVYSFYYLKSNVVHTIAWDGKSMYEWLAIGMIAMMGVMGLCFFWLPIRGVQYDAFLQKGECQLVERPWIPIVWTLGDTMLSILLLLLFIRPLKEIRDLLGDSPKSAAMLLSMKRLTKKNRNLLAVTVLVTLLVMLTIAAFDINMRTVHYLCAMDRFVTLQCITLTFTNDAREFFYYRQCLMCCLNKTSTIKPEKRSMSALVENVAPESRATPSIIVMTPNLERRDSGNKGSGSGHFDFGSQS